MERKGLKRFQPPGCSVWALQVFRWTPHSRSEDALGTPQDHCRAHRNSGTLCICIIAFSSLGVLAFSAASAADWFVVFRIDFLILVCRRLFPCWPGVCKCLGNSTDTEIVSSGLGVCCCCFSKPELLLPFNVFLFANKIIFPEEMKMCHQMAKPCAPSAKCPSESYCAV